MAPTKTSTQLRNSRKRRSLKRKRNEQQQQQQQNGDGFDRRRMMIDPSLQYIHDPLQAPIIQQARQFFDNNNNNIRMIGGCSASTAASPDNDNGRLDDEEEEESQSRKQRKQQQQQQQQQQQRHKQQWQVYMGPKYQWRTLVKLAVRYANVVTTNDHHHQSKKKKKRKHSSVGNDEDENHHHRMLLTLGLFAPKTHGLVPQSGVQCPVHHPVLNQALTRVQELARQLDIAAYSESSHVASSSLSSLSLPSTVNGCLKYVTASVERSTQLVQLTLVWQEGMIQTNHDKNDDDNNNNTKKKKKKNHVMIDKLCQAIVADAMNGTSGNVTVAGDPTTTTAANGKPQTTTSAGAITTTTPSTRTTRTSSSSWLHSLWVHYHPWDYSPHNNAIYAIDNNNNSPGDGIAATNWETKFGPNHGTQETLNLHLSEAAAPWTTTATTTTTTTTLPSPPPLPPSLQLLPLSSSSLQQQQQQQQTYIVTLPLQHLQSSSSSPPPRLPTLLFPPTVFRQANLDAFGKIVGQIRTFLLRHLMNHHKDTHDHHHHLKQGQQPPIITTTSSSSLQPNEQQQQEQQKDSTASVDIIIKKPCLLELYGGVGTIGLHLIDLCSLYICSDENPYNQTCFHHAIQSLVVVEPKVVATTTARPTTTTDQQQQPSSLPQDDDFAHEEKGEKGV